MISKADLIPHTIWERKKNGQMERVYLESLTSTLLRNGTGYVDIRTEFGSESVRIEKFLTSYIYVGPAKIRLSEIASDKNLDIERKETEND